MRLRKQVNGLKLDTGTLLALGYVDDLTIFEESDTELQKALCVLSVCISITHAYSKYTGDFQGSSRYSGGVTIA
jgi:hypothetical protein